MQRRLATLLALMLAASTLTGCALAAGGAAVVLVDEAMEDKNGDDGLF